MARAALLGVAAGIFLGAVVAQGGVTQEGRSTRGSGGVSIQALAIDPQNPRTLYAGTSKDGLFKSIDRGAKWLPINRGLTSKDVLALAIVHESPQTVYAGTRRGTFKSTDGGRLWRVAETVQHGTHALAIDPQNPRTVYAGTWEGIFKSTNGGRSWKAMNKGLEGGGLVTALAIDPATPETLYAGTLYGTLDGFFKSSNGGATWRAVAQPPPLGTSSAGVAALAIDPVTPKTIYAVSYPTDGGGNPTGPGSISKSTNAGASWVVTRRGLGRADMRTIAIAPTKPANLYAGALGEGIFISATGARSWRASSAGLTDKNVQVLAVDPKTPRTIYAGARHGMSKSTNGGQSWKAVRL